jgi:hypothetical protein
MIESRICPPSHQEGRLGFPSQGKGNKKKEGEYQRYDRRMVRKEEKKRKESYSTLCNERGTMFNDVYFPKYSAGRRQSLLILLLLQV